MQAATLLSAVVGLHSAAAAPEPGAPGPRTIAILAPPLQQVGAGPCWQTDRPGVIDDVAMAPVIDEVLRAVRGAAARSGGLDAIEIAVVGERDDCPARPELRVRLGTEFADYFVDWLAVNARTRILRRYLVEHLVEKIGGEPVAYSWDPSSDPIRVVIEAIVRNEWHDGELPVAVPDRAPPRGRRFAIIVRAARAPEHSGARAVVLAAPPAAPAAWAPRVPIELRGAPRAPRDNGQSALAVRAVVISALGTSHLGGEVEWTRSRLLGAVTARGGIRVGLLASDDEWANGGRLSRSSLGIVSLPASVDHSVGPFRVHAGVVASSLIGLAAVRGEIEVGMSRLLTSGLAIGVAGGPALTLAWADTHRLGWSSAICIERSLP